MPECMVCGETEFEEHDGHYFCSTCNTQSQDVRVTMAEEEELPNTRGLIREKTQTQRKKKEVYEGRPWSLYEAYTMVIKHQVEALIKLGAEKELKDIVFQLWSNYLHKLKVAFAESIAHQTGVKYERQRDLFLGSTKRPKIRNVYGQKSKARNVGPSSKTAERQMEHDQNVEDLQNEEFYEGDNPLSATSTTESTWDYVEEEEEGRWGRYRKDVRCTSIEKVRMMSTLSICWLGLMYTNPLTTGSDLLRWVKLKKLPYLDIYSLLDDDMKFSLNDWKCFSMGVAPSLDQLRLNTGNIAFYLKLNDIPEFPLEELIHKYIIMLDLPAEFHAYVMNLAKGMAIPTRFRATHTQRKVHDWESFTMAYIVIFMKMFFGLNDENEIQLSECTKSLEEISECSRPLFVWTDWIQHMKNRMQYEEQNYLRKADDRMVSENIYSRVSQKSEMSKSAGSRKGYLYNNTNRAKVGQPFTALSQRWKAKQLENSQASSRQAMEHQNEESFSLTGNTFNDEHVISNLLETEASGPSSQSNATGMCAADLRLKQQLKSDGERFRHCSVQHIISPDTYITDLKERWADSDTTGEVEDDDISGSIISNSCEPRATGHSKSSRPRSHTIPSRSSQPRSQSGMETGQSEDFEGIVARDIDQFENTVRRIKDIKENMRTSLDFETDTEACLSYDRLLRICCFVNGSDPAELKNVVMKFEIRSFSEQDDPGLNENGRAIRNRLIRNRGRTLFCKVHNIKTTST